YPNIKDVPGEVDYALVATPTSAALQVVSDCAEKGLAGISIYTSGFREKGEQGLALEKKLVEVARRGGMRIIGPNCMGIYSPSSHLTIRTGMPMVDGSVGLISHSGSLCMFITDGVLSLGMGISKAVSCGNESDLTAVDFLEYYGQDPKTKTIVCYLEGIKDGQRFVRLAREISQIKPIIVWKSGLTERGARAAASHTGAMAGSREIWQGAFKQTGITLVRSGEEMMDCLQGMAVSKLPAGRNVVIISGPGGPAVAASDAIVESGLYMAELSQETRERVSNLIPAVGTSIDNPLDLGRPATPGIGGYYVEPAKAAAADSGVDMFLCIGGSLLNHRTMFERGQSFGKPMALAMGFNLEVTMEDHKFFNDFFGEDGMPLYSEPRHAARMLSALADRSDFLRKAASEAEPVHGKKADHQTVKRARKEGREVLSEHDSKKLLASYGVPVTQEELVVSRHQALVAAAKIGYPVGLKACGSHILHKTEMDLVELNLKDSDEVGAAFERLMEKSSCLSPDGILVQEMVSGGRELVAGLVQDHQFGPCVMVGIGGIFTEALKDISFRVAPFGKAEALEMIGEIRAQKLLGAFRGSDPVDLNCLADLLVGLSRLAFEQEAVKEIDINPLIVGKDGKLVAVDALVVLKAGLS
ncbi:MAG: acetate--CoA ligase family protein, partial [Dehalococcoidia bacterium]|nr:acetate--CoA ligase family protein [Dehalococcoidia bacterium]